MQGYSRKIARLLLLAASAWLAGCASDLPAPRGGKIVRERLGTLQVIGPNVYLNGRRARDGEGVYAEDSVNTGNDSSAVIDLVDGQLIQLDENTDPKFRFVVRKEAGRRCVYLYIEVGRVWVDGDMVCFETPDGAGVIYSAVNIDVGRGATEVTVLKGRVSITAPQERSVSAGEQATMTRGGDVRVRRLDPGELRDVIRWRERFERPDKTPRAWCCDARRGAVYETTAEACQQAGGRPFKGEAEAKRFCAAPEPAGWCCGAKGLFPGSAVECRRAGARYFADRREAEERCRPATTSPGWCCSRARGVFPGTRESCYKQKATFFEEERQARKECAAAEQSYCCTRRGRVEQMTRELCTHQRGTPYQTKEEAAKDRKCFIE